MLTRRRAYEARVWRLALLLTGDRARAGELVADVLGHRADPSVPDAAHLDRLVIQASRRAAPSPPEGTDAAHARLLALPAQAREAWILSRVDGLDELAVARAMDCSRTAARRHLVHADDLLAQADPMAFAERIRTLADAEDPRAGVAAHRAETRTLHRRKAVRAAAIIALLASLAAMFHAAGLF